MRQSRPSAGAAGLLQLEELEARKAALETDFRAPAPAPLRFHPRLAERYRQKVAEPSQTVPNEAIRTPALDVLRGLIKRVVVHHKGANGGLALEPEGAITAMIEHAQPAALRGVDTCSVALVAGARIGVKRTASTRNS